MRWNMSILSSDAAETLHNRVGPFTDRTTVSTLASADITGS